MAGSLVALRPFRSEDYTSAVAASDTAATVWGASMPAVDGAGVAEYIEECRHDGVLLLMVIADRSTDEYLGEVMLSVGEHGVGEVGCIVSPGARRQGCAAEALELLVRWAFDSAGFARLQVFVAATNAGGLALARRAGFRREGLLRSYLELDGARVDAVLLARLPGD